MTDPVPRSGRRTRRRGGGAAKSSTSKRTVNYHSLKNPFTPQTVFSEDRIEAIHSTALRVLQELGISAEAEITPHTIELENESLRLQGNVDEQYTELAPASRASKATRIASSPLAMPCGVAAERKLFGAAATSLGRRA
mgnify:CR=1 FL=1